MITYEKNGSTTRTQTLRMGSEEKRGTWNSLNENGQKLLQTSNPFPCGKKRTTVADGDDIVDNE